MKIKSSRKSSTISFHKNENERLVEIHSGPHGSCFEVIDVMNGKTLGGNVKFEEPIRLEAMNAWNLI